MKVWQIQLWLCSGAMHPRSTQSSSFVRSSKTEFSLLLFSSSPGEHIALREYRTCHSFCPWWIALQVLLRRHCKNRATRGRVCIVPSPRNKLTDYFLSRCTVHAPSLILFCWFDSKSNRPHLFLFRSTNRSISDMSLLSCMFLLLSYKLLFPG